MSVVSGEALQKVALSSIYATFSVRPNVHAHKHRELKLQMSEFVLRYASQHQGERVVTVEWSWP